MSKILPTPEKSIKVDVYQISKLHDIAEDLPGYNTLLMHNKEEDSSMPIQIDKLTEGELMFADFRHEKGYLVNDKHKLAIIMPEKDLEEQHLFSEIKNKFDFSSDNLVFITKKSASEINHLVRENHEKGDIELNGKSFKVFEHKASGNGDQTRVMILKNETPKIKVKAKSVIQNTKKPTNRPR